MTYPARPTEQAIYRRVSIIKRGMALRHLRDLRDILDGMRGQLLGTPLVSEYWEAGDCAADACVVQLYAAFDAFACSVAHAFGMGNPDAASFTGHVPGGRTAESRALRDSMRAISADPAFRRLDFYRNLAAHRGLVAEGWVVEGYRNTGAVAYPALRAGGIRGAPDPPGTPIADILADLFESTRPALEWLWGLTEGWDPGWTPPR
jgi:hypothetical protein